VFAHRLQRRWFDMSKHEMDEIPDVSYIHNEGVAHEESDLNLDGIIKFVIHLIVLVVASAGIVYGMYRFFSGQEYEQEKSETPSTLLKREQRASGKVEDMFPEPRLQTLPVIDLDAYRAAEKQKLEKYNWLDKEKGIVSIPIEEAKKKLLEQLKAKPAEMVQPQGQAKTTEQAKPKEQPKSNK
jgi:flagellar basal body-associated protein FliL